MSRRASLRALLILTIALPGAGAAAESRSPQAPAAPVSAPAAPASRDDDATVHHPFDDVEHWREVFDDPERDSWQHPEALVKALALIPGDRVADLGAGTGYFSRWLAQAVGERGTVFAVEVEPNLVAHLRKRAEEEGTANVVPVLASLDNPRLPAAAVDRILIVDTYHHLDDRRAYLARLASRLRPRGRIAIVDFRRRPLPVGPPLEHKIAPSQVLEEMAAAGYDMVGDYSDLLPYQYMYLFEPRDPAPGPGSPAAPTPPVSSGPPASSPDR